jgi:hypothetical protein
MKLLLDIQAKTYVKIRSSNTPRLRQLNIFLKYEYIHEQKKKKYNKGEIFRHEFIKTVCYKNKRK